MQSGAANQSSLVKKQWWHELVPMAHSSNLKTLHVQIEKNTATHRKWWIQTVWVCITWKGLNTFIYKRLASRAYMYAHAKNARIPTMVCNLQQAALIPGLDLQIWWDMKRCTYRKGMQGNSTGNLLDSSDWKWWQIISGKNRNTTTVQEWWKNGITASLGLPPQTKHDYFPEGTVRLPAFLL